MGLLAVGDLHGCPRTLEALLARLAPTPDDELVFVGDYVDRGPDSAGLLERLLALEAAAADGRGPRCLFLRGNHDQMMLDAVERPHDGEAQELWRINGGGRTVESYGARGIAPAHLDFLARTRLFYDRPDFFFVHAGLKPDRTVAAQAAAPSARTFLWERGHLEADRLAWEKPVVCGHTPVAEPLNLPRLLAIDTGAVYPQVPGLGRLTAVRLPQRTFESVAYQG